MITYNHEKYIKQAIESVLMQKCDFDYEIIIGEDASTDNTRNEILKLKKKYPQIIKPILQDKNIGMLPNFAKTIQVAKGEYIALLEGDDYWTDPNKLQKQVDFLEANPEFVASSTAYSQLEEKSATFIDKKNVFSSDIIKIEDLIDNNYISTLTCVFRNNLFKEFPQQYYNLKVGDWPLHVLNAQFGNVKYFSNWVSGAYRIHENGVWSNQKKIQKLIAYADVYVFFKQTLQKKYHKQISKKIVDYYYSIASVYIAEKNKKEAKKIIQNIKKECSPFNKKHLKIRLKYLLNK
ncbi:MAG: glycosyltransferase [Chlorobi bacterium]|nr:glycosyltransferase [Chlorobiota bacterium]